ncbi:MAG: hypothetical protein AAFR58_18905 [Cyanobacteria bacterium J06627_28]
MQQDQQYLIDILQAAQRIQEYIADTSLPLFYADITLQDKVMGRLLNIDKTSQRISAATCEEISDIEWHRINTLKSRLLQESSAPEQLWNIVQTEIPTLVKKLTVRMLSEERSNSLGSDTFAVQG